MMHTDTFARFESRVRSYQAADDRRSVMAFAGIWLAFYAAAMIMALSDDVIAKAVMYSALW